MEANQISRKRKQRSTNPLTGIFTRSKSRRYLHHCNRSGKLRPDPIRKTRPVSPPYHSIAPDGFVDVSHGLIKDLRARRVFSQPLPPNAQSAKITENPNLLEKGEKFDVGLACNGSISDNTSPNLRDEDLIDRVFENEQTTPPEAVISADTILVVKGNDSSSSSSQKQVSPNKDDGKKTISILKKTSGLRPCSRPKVFRAPNSFSYRRLLPYLMDLAKDTSSPLTFPKIENSDAVKSVVSSSRDNLCVGKQVKTVLANGVEEPTVGNKEDKEISLYPDSSTPIHRSLVDGGVCLVASGNQNVTRVLNESPKGGSPDGEQISLDNRENFEDASPVIESHIEALSQSPEALEKDAAVEAPCHLSLYAAGECPTSQVEFKTNESSISVFHSSSKVKGFVSSSGPILRLGKGILKKNPRGCRGICNCLNCATFRLNAEQAFEFSRNQLLDTEELVQDMIKEIENLRCLLEKSANGAKRLSSIPVNQVQEACSRASNVETMARNRLTQMNEDLYVHSRTKSLQRPRVNFSVDVKEEIMGELNKQIEGNAISKRVKL